MSEPFLGEIRIVGFNFAPRGWALCNGQLLAISQNSALFSLLGVTYGGNGQTTFALPDLRGRAPLHYGQGPGLSDRTPGERSGTETVSLISSQMPLHNHPVTASTESATAKSPAGAVPAFTSAPAYVPAPIDTTMAPQMVGPAGGGQPHENMQPYLVVNFVIALVGIFPSRN